MIPVVFNAETYMVKIPSDAFKKNEIEFLSKSYFFYKCGRHLITHYLYFHRLTKDYPELEFDIPDILEFHVKKYFRIKDSSEKIKEMETKLQHTEGGTFRVFPKFKEMLDKVVLKPGIQLKPHQESSVIFANYLDGMLIGDEMGLGKTLTSFSIFQSIREPGQKMIYVTKVDLVSNVISDMNDKCPTLKLFDWGKSGAKADREVLKMDWDVLVMNLDKFRTRMDQLTEIYYHLVQSNNFACLVVDECTSLKCSFDGSTSQMTTNFMRLLHANYDKVKIKIGLSGTPIENSISDIFNLYYCIDRSLIGLDYQWFSENFLIFKYRRVLRYGKYVSEPSGVKKGKNINDLKFLIRHKFFQRFHTDVPGFNYIEIPVFLSPSEKSQYNEIVDRIDKPVEEGGITVSEGINLTTKFLGSCRSKLSMLESVLENRTQKDIIFTKYIENSQTPAFEYISKTDIGKNSVFVNGTNISKWKNSDHLTNDFKENYDYLFASDALQHGYNFQFANRVIHYGLPDKPSSIRQRNGRVRRIGQTNKVYSIVIYVAGSIEEDHLNRLKEKEKTLDGMTVNLYETEDETGTIHGIRPKRIK